MFRDTLRLIHLELNLEAYEERCDINAYRREYVKYLHGQQLLWDKRAVYTKGQELQVRSRLHLETSDQRYSPKKLKHDMSGWCFKIRQFTLLDNEGGTQSPSVQQICALVSRHRHVWCRSILTVNNILDNKLSPQGLSGEDAISLVSLAHCLCVANKFNLFDERSPEGTIHHAIVNTVKTTHRFCSFSEFRTDLHRYTEMVKLEDRAMFCKFVELMYEVDVSKCVKLELTENVSYFASLFQHIAAEVNELPFVDAETQTTEASDCSHIRGNRPKSQGSFAGDLPNFPSPRLRWDPGGCWNWNVGEGKTFPILTVVVAATVTFGLILAFFLEQYSTEYLDTAIRLWREKYGEENTTWSATVARNYYVAFQLLLNLGYPFEWLNTVTLDHGAVLDLDDAEASTDVDPSLTANATFTASPETETIADTPLSEHSTSTSSSNQRERKCPHCKKCFPNASSFHKHLRHPPKKCNNPNKPPLASCRWCGKTPTNKHNLKTHENEHCKKRRMESSN